MPHGPSIVSAAVQLFNVGFFWEAPKQASFPEVPWAVTANVMFKNTNQRSVHKRLQLMLCAALTKACCTHHLYQPHVVMYLLPAVDACHTHLTLLHCKLEPCFSCKIGTVCLLLSIFMHDYACQETLLLRADCCQSDEDCIGCTAACLRHSIHDWLCMCLVAMQVTSIATSDAALLQLQANRCNDT